MKCNFNFFFSDMNTYGLNWFLLIKSYFSAHTFCLIRLYRIGNWLYKHHIRFIPVLIKKRMLRRYACEISPYADIGEGFRVYHSVGIVIGHEVVIGKNCEVFQNVTIGSNRKKKNGRFMPIIGDNVQIGSGAVVVGSITIGDNSRIGANSYVDKDVPSNTLVAGVPAKPIRQN